MFNYDDIVRVRQDAPADLRPGAKAWVIGITPDRERAGKHFDQFPPGTIYLVEFEGGGAFDIHEDMLEAGTMADNDAPYHAHIYFEGDERDAAAALHDGFRRGAGPDGPVLFVGRMNDGPAGPHPIPQFEVHFLKRSLDQMLATIRASGLRALVHPLTDDDLADHTSLGQWIGAPIELDVSLLDPVGRNQGIPRFGKTDF